MLRDDCVFVNWSLCTTLYITLYTTGIDLIVGPGLHDCMEGRLYSRTSFIYK